MSITPDCLAQLGLQTEPFGPVPDPAAIYRDTLLDGFAELAVRALSEPNALLVLAGAGGVGRSVQLQQILGDFDEDADLIAFRARPKANFEALDATIRFQLSGIGSSEPSASLLHLFGERMRAGRIAVLAIDDAHLLASGVLEQLFGLRRQLLARLGSAARFLMVGDPAFAANPLPGLGAEEDMHVLRLHLRAFNREQTHSYLSHRLRAAGHPQPELLLKRDLVDGLHRSSHGLPKYLNALAEDWLRELCGHNGSPSLDHAGIEEQASRRWRPTHAAPQTDPMVSTIAALGALRQASRAAINDQTESPQIEGTATAQQPSAATGKQTRQAIQQGPKNTKSAAPVNPAPNPSDRAPLWNRRWFIPGVAIFSLLALFLPLAWQWHGPGGTGNKPAADQSTWLGNSATQRQRELTPLVPGAPRLGPPVDSGREIGAKLPRELRVPDILPRIADEAAAENPASQPTGDSAPSETILEPPPSSAEASATDSARVVETAAQEPTPPPATPQLSQDSADPEPPQPVSDRDWLLAQPPQHFTIQLAAENSLAAAQSHLEGISGVEAHFVPTWSRSRGFVVVLVGVYPTEAAAERAFAQLPWTLRNQGHWVRTIDSVRQSLR